MLFLCKRHDTVLDACFFFACAVIHSRTLAAVCQHTSSLEDAAADLLGAKSYCGACLHLVGMCTGSAPAAVAQGCPCILAGALHACSGVGALLIRVRQSGLVVWLLKQPLLLQRHCTTAPQMPLTCCAGFSVAWLGHIPLLSLVQCH